MEPTVVIKMALNYFRKALVCLAVGLFVSLVTPLPAFAAEEQRQFLEALRNKGYADTALDYLNLLEKQERLSPELKETLELEKSDCYRVAAKRAYSPEQAQKYLSLAKEHLDKFTKVYPNHPAGVNALLAQADFDLEGALQQLSVAKQATGTEKTKAMTDARTALLACRGRYTAVREQFSKFIAEYAKSPLPTNRKLNPAETKIKDERERTEVGFVESLLKEGLINYQIGLTYPDLKSADRKKILQEAIKLFDLCFRKYSAQSDIGLQANHWKAKSLQELGDFVTAMDILDEIQVLEPTGGKVSEPTAIFYAQIALDRIKLLRLQGKADMAERELNVWLDEHKTSGKLPSYQGLALEKVRLLIANAEKDTKDKPKLLQEAQVILAGIIKVESEFKSEAILLRRQLQPGEGKDPTTLDEAYALAESAASAENWAEAKSRYEQSIKLGTAKETKKIEEVQQRLNQVMLQIAWKDYQNSKIDEAMTTAKQLMGLDKSDPIAASGAGLAITIAHQQYLKKRVSLDQKDNLDEAKMKKTLDEEAALKIELNEIAKAIIEKWPSRIEADEARIILGQQALETADFSGAFKLLAAVSADSKRYAPTQLLIGQMFWKKYVEEKKAQGENFDPKAPSKFRDGAIQYFQTAVKSLEAGQSADESLNETAIDARQILTQALLEAQNPKAACEAVKPLIDSWAKHKPEKVDLTMLRTANVALKANLLNDNVQDAEKVVTLLLEIGTDTTEVNTALVDFARAIRRESTATLEAQQAASKASDLKALSTIDKKLAGLRSIESNMLDKLTKRENYGLGGMIYLAETLNAIGRPLDSRAFYKAILDRAENDQTFHKTAEKMLTRIRAQVIGLLTAEGKYQEALKQVDQLIEAHPRSLEPKVEKARILTAWARKQPKEHMNAAINEWSNIRVVLHKMSTKPPEYYEAIMNVADCLILQAELAKDSKKAEQAEQLLNATLKVNPKLNGPETVQLFEKTIQKALATQKKTAKAL